MLKVGDPSQLEVVYNALTGISDGTVTLIKKGA